MAYITTRELLVQAGNGLSIKRGGYVAPGGVITEALFNAWLAEGCIVEVVDKPLEVERPKKKGRKPKASED